LNHAKSRLGIPVESAQRAVGINAAEGDRIDLSALLPGYDGSANDLSQFVQLQVSGGDTVIRIAGTTPGVIDTDVVRIQGVTGLDLATLKQNGTLIA
jgi:hypothetical protein